MGIRYDYVHAFYRLMK